MQFLQRNACAMAVVLLIGCSQPSDAPTSSQTISVTQSTEIKASQSGTSGTPEKSAETDDGNNYAAGIDSGGSVAGMMTVPFGDEDNEYELKHVVSYRMVGDPGVQEAIRVSTWVLLTSDPVNLDELKEQFGEHGDLGLGVESQWTPSGVPYLIMQFDRDGKLRQLHSWAKGSSYANIGRTDNIFEQKPEVADGRIKGKVKLATAGENLRAFECTIDVKHFTE
jgi:hypothetical protein